MRKERAGHAPELFMILGFILLAVILGAGLFLALDAIGTWLAALVS